MLLRPLGPVPADPLFVQVVRAAPAAGSAPPTYRASEGVRWDVELGVGVHRWTIDSGFLRPGAAGWTPDRRRITARDDATADRVAAAIHDAYAGFRALQIPPGDHRVQRSHPDWIDVTADTVTWRFDAPTAPAEVRALARAARLATTPSHPSNLR